RHTSRVSTSTTSNVICCRCRSNPPTIAIKDLLTRARALDKPQGCLATNRGGPHTWIVSGHSSLRDLARLEARNITPERAILRGVEGDQWNVLLPDIAVGRHRCVGMVLASGHDDTLRARYSVIAPDDGSGTMFVVSS